MSIKKVWRPPKKFEKYHSNRVKYDIDCNCVDVDYCKMFCSGKEQCDRYELLCRENAHNCDLTKFITTNELSIGKG